MIWIRNAHVIDPTDKTEKNVDICISDGKITAIGEHLEFTVAKEDVVIDASGYVVAPGLMDVHVHFRDP